MRRASTSGLETLRKISPRRRARAFWPGSAPPGWGEVGRVTNKLFAGHGKKPGLVKSKIKNPAVGKRTCTYGLLQVQVEPALERMAVCQVKKLIDAVKI